MYGICFLCMERCKPLGPLSSFLSYAAQLSGANPVFLFTVLLAFPQLLSNHLGAAASPRLQSGEPAFTFLKFLFLLYNTVLVLPAFTFEGQKSLMAVTSLVY